MHKSEKAEIVKADKTAAKAKAAWAKADEAATLAYLSESCADLQALNDAAEQARLAYEQAAEVAHHVRANAELH